MGSTPARHRALLRWLLEAPTLGAQGNNTNYADDDLKGNADAAARTEDEGEEIRFTYSGQAGATDRGEAFELTPAEQDPRMAGEDADSGRDYTSGFGNAEAFNRAFETVIEEDTDYWDLATNYAPGGYRQPLPPIGVSHLADDSEEPEESEMTVEQKCGRLTTACGSWWQCIKESGHKRGHDYRAYNPFSGKLVSEEANEDDDRSSAEPPDGKQLLTEPESWDTPWGGQSEGLVMPYFAK